MTKKITQRQLGAFYRERAIRIAAWRNSAGLSREYVAEKLGVSAESVRGYENPIRPTWLRAEKLRALAALGCPKVILYLDGRAIHEMEIEK